LFLGGYHALYGGVVAGAVALGGQWILGSVYSGYEARQFLESMSSSALYFGSAVVTGTTTILALMLTLLSLTSQSESDFDRLFYSRIKRIGQLATAGLMGGILLLLFLSIPVKDAQNTPASWFTIMYYLLMTFLAILAGLLISIVLMLQNAIGSLIKIISPNARQEDRGSG
jgi:ABC-type multidrug transport system permease subunit